VLNPLKEDGNMSEAKDGSKSSARFPNLNYLLLALLAGTLFIAQEPFHESRPRNPDTAIVYQVNARPWQDPFEAVDRYIAKNDTKGSPDNREEIRNAVTNKANAHGLKKINVIAVMLPGGGYYEDGETRRKLRYAVLSGFNAALRYMPEDSSHLQFFHTQASGNLKSSPVVYEWLIYPPARARTVKDERSYERPPVLVLWLNNEDFRVTSHEKLKRLIDDSLGKSDKEKIGVGSVSVLGPFNSNDLQDLISEVASVKEANDNKEDNDIYQYYSPSATVWECNFLWNIKQPDYPKDIKPDGHNYFNLQEYFAARHLSFLRVTATDWDLALTVKEELKRRGINPGKRDRILLIGEWDSLYTWHLNTTFAEVFMREDPINRCVMEKNTGNKEGNEKLPLQEHYILQASYLRGLDGEKPDSAGSAVKPQRQNKQNTDLKTEAINNLEEANGDSQFDYIRRLTDQAERLDQEIRDGKNWDYPDSRAIKAFGILGSDAYDKLLIIEALHGKFPDAVFFTNGIDARLLEPKNNEWARNLVIASSYGLTLRNALQRDIPPFRDNLQTAYFLATEMALAKQFNQEKDYAKNDLIFDDNILSLLRTARQTDFDKLLMPGSKPLARLFEVGRTHSFDLNPELSCKSRKSCLHPDPPEQNGHGFLLPVFIAFFGVLLLFVKPSRKFLGQRSGLWFISSMTVLCWSLLAGIHCGFFEAQNGNFDGFLMLKLIIIAWLYAVLMYGIICFDKKLPDSESANSSEETRKMFFIGVNLAIIAIGSWMIWFFERPLHGLLNISEPYALWEGVSMWPSQAIRFLAFILAGFFVIEVSNFPYLFTKWLEKDLLKLEGARSIDVTTFSLLNQWWNWKETHCKRNLILGFSILFFLETAVLWFSGVPNVPFRGTEMFSLNILLLQGLLLPASLILFVLISDAAIIAVALVESCTFGEIDDNPTRWPRETLIKFSNKFDFPDSRGNLNEWIGVRFIGELTRQIYGFIGYPLVIALLLVLACSSYFDNWIMPFYMKLSIGFCMGWLLYWDYRLKAAADKAREHALITLRLRVMKFQSKEQTKPISAQLERLISMIEHDKATVYKSFTQRPIFMNALLIMIALLADSVDYFMLASKLFWE
jgi:hypothetical protein